MIFGKLGKIPNDSPYIASKGLSGNFANGIAYVAVDEAKRALHGKTGVAGAKKLKSFDFVVYSESGSNLLIDVKGRKHSGKTGRSLQNWVTRDDVSCMETWSGIFGNDFEPAFAFLFWCDAQPPDALFLEVFEFNDRWYAVLAVRLSDYVGHMRDRSAKWDTVSLPAAAFNQVSVELKSLL
ncbi:MAG: HYExAFE family protein [Planctomycetota bacterium]